MDNLASKEKKYSDYDIATFIAMKKFDEKHPKEKQLDWLEKYMMNTIKKITNKKWIVRKILFLKTKLEANQHWEQSAKGNPLLIEVDPITGKESVVFNGGSSQDVKVLFEVEVDLDNNAAVVTVDTDMNILDETKYQIQRP